LALTPPIASKFPPTIRSKSYTPSASIDEVVPGAHGLPGRTVPARDAIGGLPGDGPSDQLREVFNLWRDWFSGIHFNGCLFIHACSEFPDRRDPCHIAAMENVNALRDVVRGLAEDAGLIDAEAFTRQFSLLMQGSIVLEVMDREGTAAQTGGVADRALLADVSVGLTGHGACADTWNEHIHDIHAE
jgi:hypothetical protein